MRNVLLRPLGLITRPNRYGQFPPGALSTCVNVALRDRGILSSLPGVRELTDGAMSSGSAVKGIFPIDTDRMLLAGNDRMRFIDGAAASAVTRPPEFPSNTWTFDTVAGTSHAARTRGRTFVCSDQGVVAYDDGTSFTAPRAAGLPYPEIAAQAVTATNAQSAANNTVRSYRALFIRKRDTGYDLVSETSVPIKITNTSGGTVDYTLRVDWLSQPAGIAVAGDQVEIYRTRDVASGTDPGDRMLLCARYTLLSADVTNGYADVRDTSVDASLADEFLYTNPEQQGLEETNTPPPLAYDACMFKGHALYLSRKVLPYFKLTVNGPIGDLTTTAQRLYGVGRRTLTVDTTNGSPTLINGSNMNGVEIGQLVTGAGIPADTRITNVAGTTITISQNATATAAGVSITTYDVIEYGPGASDYQVIIPPDVSLRSMGTAAGGISVFYTNTPITYACGAGPALTPTNPDVGRTYVWRAARYCDGTFTIRATNGGNYTPELPNTSSTAVNAITDERGNRFHTSKPDQPEAVPVHRFQFVGAGDAHRLIPTKDTVYVFASDGLHRITGTEWPWRVDPVDRTLVLVDRLAVDVLDDVIYALTNRGLVAIVGDQVDELSREVIDLGVDGMEVGDGHNGMWMVACDSKHREVWLTHTYQTESTTYIYNVMTRSFVQFDPNELISRVVYHKGLGSIVYTDSDSAPDVNYFRDDSDTTRLSGADVRFQPVTGDESPFSQKHWSECEWLFEGIGSAATLVPSFEGTNYTARAIPTSAIESKCKVAVPRNGGAIGSRLRPGFTLSSGGTSQIWSLRGLALRFTSVAEQGVRR